MIITYRCRCGHEFDGHWDEAEKRRQQQLEAAGPIKCDVFAAEVCPKCGNKERKRNLDCDEDFTPEEATECD